MRKNTEEMPEQSNQRRKETLVSLLQKLVDRRNGKDRRKKKDRRQLDLPFDGPEKRSQGERRAGDERRQHRIAEE